MGEHRLRFFVPPHQQKDAVVDLRDAHLSPEEKLAMLVDLADSLASYVHSVRSGEIAVSDQDAFSEIATKADIIHDVATNEHERTP